MSKFFNTQEFQKYSSKFVDLIVKNHQNYRSKNPFPLNAKPGFMRKILPKDMPEKETSMEEILKETEEVILPNILSWQHPRFFGYFQASTSHPAVLAEMIKTAVNPIGFQWASSPASTEIENIVCDWTVQLLNLPSKFLLSESGGGTIGTTVGDAHLLAIQYAKYKKMKELGISFGDPQLNKFSAYISDYGFNTYFKHCYTKEILHVRRIPSNYKGKDFQLDMDYFKKVLNEDKNNGLIPFFYGGSLGSTCMNASDPFDELGNICKEEKILYNVDAAYASSYLCIDSIRKRYNLENINLLNINFSKAGLCSMGSSQFFVDDKKLFVEAISGVKDSPLITLSEYLKNDESLNDSTVDYTNWQVGFGRRFDALKMLFVMQRFGAEGIREYIQYIMDLSDYAVEVVRRYKYYEILTEKTFSLICLRFNNKPDGSQFGSVDELNSFIQKFVKELNLEGFIFLNCGGHVSSGVKFIRFHVGSYETTRKDIDEVFEHMDKVYRRL